MATRSCTTLSERCRAGDWSVTVRKGQPATDNHIEGFRKSYRLRPPPLDEILNFLARRREATGGRGWPHCHALCDDQSLTSTGRWPPEHRRYSNSSSWLSVVQRFRACTESFGTLQLLALLALGHVQECSFSAGSISDPRLATDGGKLNRRPSDRVEVPIDFQVSGSAPTSRRRPRGQDW